MFCVARRRCRVVHHCAAVAAEELPNRIHRVALVHVVRARPSVSCVAMRGTITLIVGPMFSGKTSEMQQRIVNAIIAGRTAVVFTPERDTRNASAPVVVSHSGTSIGAIRAQRLADVVSSVPKGCKALVGIDEGQFFDDLAPFCDACAAGGVDVVVAALNSDAHRRPWQSVARLFPLADNIVFRHATCVRCQSQSASRSRVIAPLEQDGTSNARVPFVLVGADETYVSTCSACYEEPLDRTVLAQRALAVQKVRKLMGK